MGSVWHTDPIINISLKGLLLVSNFVCVDSYVVNYIVSLVSVSNEVLAVVDR
jgi:hypothetical protein